MQNSQEEVHTCPYCDQKYIARRRIIIPVKLLDPIAKMPEFKTDGSVCADLYATSRHFILPGEKATIRTGIALEIPVGYEGQVRSRSGISAKLELILLNGIGTIDADYRGEIRIPVKNISNANVYIEPGHRVAQLAVRRAEYFLFREGSELSLTGRGENGFGSTGI